MSEEKQLNSLTLEELFEALKTSPEGLTSKEAARRKVKTPDRLSHKPWRCYITEFEILILLSIIVSLIFAKYILTIILLSAFLIELIAFARERRVVNMLRVAREILSFPSVLVRRDGVLKQISWNDCVPGDVAELYPHSRAYADIRVIDSYQLLTETVDGVRMENPHCISSGSVICSGWVKGVLLTEPTTQLQLLPSPHYLTPVRTSLPEWLTILLATAIIIFIFQTVKTTTFLLPALLFFLSAPFIFRITRLLLSTRWANLFLSYGMLPRDRRSISALGEVHNIAFPAQTLLTTGNVIVRRIYANCKRVLYSDGDFSFFGGESNEHTDKAIGLIFKIALLVANSFEHIILRRYDKAIMEFVRRMGSNYAELTASEYKFRSGYIETGLKGGFFLLEDERPLFVVGGDPRELIRRSAFLYYNSAAVPLPAESKEKLLEICDEFRYEGFDVIAYGYRLIEGIEESEDPVQGLILVGFIAFDDEFRMGLEEIKGLVKSAQLKLIAIVKGGNKYPATARFKKAGWIDSEREVFTLKNEKAEFGTVSLLVNEDVGESESFLMDKFGQNLAILATAPHSDDANAVRIARMNSPEMLKQHGNFIWLRDELADLVTLIDKAKHLIAKTCKTELLLTWFLVGQLLCLAASIIQVKYFKVFEFPVYLTALNFLLFPALLLTLFLQSGKIRKVRLNILKFVGALAFGGLSYLLLRSLGFREAEVDFSLLPGIFSIFLMAGTFVLAFLTDPPFSFRFIGKFRTISVSVLILGISLLFYLPSLQSIFALQPIESITWLYIAVIAFVYLLILEATRSIGGSKE